VPASAGPILELQDITRRFGGLVAVNQFSMTVRPQSTTALIGPNGAGKTTVFNLISGLLRPDRGRVLFDGEEITHWRPQVIARRGLVRTFQLLSVFGRMTVLENLEVVGGAHSRPRALELLDRGGMAGLREEYAGNLPYGQQKLLDVLRSLMLNPALILLDEPAAGLSRLEQERLFSFFHELRTGGRSILIIEHQMHLIREHADWVIVMNFGEKLIEGSYEEIRHDERVLTSYFGT
jgi:branched-chain amino acid transport system ATP-binding protein